MSYAAHIATYLNSSANAALGLTLGTNLFVGTEPPSPADCVTVYDTGGSAPSQDYSGTSFVYRPSVQIRTRNRDFLIGDALIKDIRDVVKQIVHTTLSGTRYDGVFLATSDIHLGKITTNAGLAHVWTLNLDLITED